MQVEHSATVELKLDTTWDEIRSLAEEAEVPGSAKIRIDQYEGDQRDPGYTRITWKWTTGSGRLV